MSRPQNIGIKAIEVYIPGQYVEQADLEKFDGIAAGKYTIGLGLTRMAFVNDREDIYSLALTAVSQLLAKNKIDPADIGRLEVGTETLIDKSKSVKTVLMQLFGDNADIEGVDTVNACYGGTNALFNAINWVESSSWDGRDAIVVAGDIAIYAKGAARPTGGVGTVAMLIGPDAPLVVEPQHGSYMAHAYDFYKPDFTSEYPVVDGHFSLACYTRALDQAYQAYNRKSKNDQGMDRFAFSAFHTPTCKQASKSFARLQYNDYLANPSKFTEEQVPKDIAEISYENSIADRNVEKTFLAVAKHAAKRNFEPSIQAATNVGNIYTGSLYLSLASLLTFAPAEDLAGQRISMYSYGSGLAASFFSVKVTEDAVKVASLSKTIGLKALLDEREKVTPEGYEAALALREKAHLKSSFKPEGSTDHLRKGTYFLQEIDDKFRRHYSIKQ